MDYKIKFLSGQIIVNKKINKNVKDFKIIFLLYEKTFHQIWKNSGIIDILKLDNFIILQTVNPKP